MTIRIHAVAAAAFAVVCASHATEPLAHIENRDGIGATAGDTALFWRTSPVAMSGNLAKFSTSGYFHSLRTPAGFELLTVHPADHPHHCGLWWPWKFVEVGGKRYNTWEVQEGQGAHVAKAARRIGTKKDELDWELTSEAVVNSPDAGASTAILETTLVSLADVSPDTRVLDIDIRQKAAAAAVKIVNYRYSGFSWRGPTSWNKDNSTMTTSGGKNRDTANGTPARWVVVSGPTPQGMASMLMMSAAADIAGTEESLRVWDSKAENGAPFVNFNPVMDNALPLDADHPAVARRKYRVIAADRMIDAAAAEAEWRKWMGK
jgi:Methane oxygenase PmoA